MLTFSIFEPFLECGSLEHQGGVKSCPRLVSRAFLQALEAPPPFLAPVVCCKSQVRAASKHNCFSAPSQIQGSEWRLNRKCSH